MAVFEDTLYTQIIVDASKATAELNQFASLGRKMGFATKAGADMGYQVDQIGNALGRGSSAFKVFNSNMKEASTRFDMNTLSWIFGGMALQRLGLMMTRFFIPSMEQLSKLNDTASKRVMGMTAAFEFLKISLFETLASTPMFAAFVEWVVKGAIWIAEFAQKHDQVVAIAAAFAGILATLGTIAMGVGIFDQTAHLATLLGFTSTGAIKTAGAEIGKLVTAGLALGLAAVSLTITYKTLFEDLSFNIIDSLNAAMTGGAAYGIITGSISKGFTVALGTFAIVTTLQMIEDPLGFGEFVARVMNSIANVLTWLDKMQKAFGQAFLDIFSGKGIKAAMGNFDFSDVFAGIERGIQKLRDEGKLNPWMEQGLINAGKLSAPYDEAAISINTMTGNIDTAMSTTNLFGQNALMTIGDDKSPDSVIGRFSLLNNKITENNTSFTSFTTEVDAWKPPAKYIDIYYRTHNAPASAPTLDGDSTGGTVNMFGVRQYQSSVTDGGD